MTPEMALVDLIELVAACRKSSFPITEDQLSEWPSEAMAAMQQQKLLKKTKEAKRVICDGCHRRCDRPVERQPPARPFVICEKDSGICVVPLTDAQLTQWQSSMADVCRFIAECLDIRYTNTPKENNAWLIGSVMGKKKSQLLFLSDENPQLALKVASNVIDLSAVITFNNNAYSLDQAKVVRLVDASTQETIKITKNAARKLTTQERNAEWQKQYLALKKQNKKTPRTRNWYAKTIYEAAVTDGYSGKIGTVNKNMMPT